MKKLIVICLLALSGLVAQSLYAQSFETAAGVRLGYPISLSIKKFVNTSNAIEVYVGTRTRGYLSYSSRNFNLSAAYLIHEDLGIDGLDGLGFYYGGGGSVFMWTWRAFNGVEFNFAVQGYGGLYYVLELDDRPIEFTLDWVPTFWMGGTRYDSRRFRFSGDYGTVGIRFGLN